MDSSSSETAYSSPNISNSSAGVDDKLLDPYFINPSDSADLILVSKQLVEDNYFSWSISMMAALSLKNKVGFIDGTLQRPSDDRNLLRAWLRNNKLVISWILNSVSKEISESVDYFDLASVVWLDLKEQFQQRNQQRIFGLHRELMNSHQGDLSVKEYFTKIETIWEKLDELKPSCCCGKCTCGGVRAIADLNQKEYLLTFLKGLHDSLAEARERILQMEPIPLMDKTYSIILQEEEQNKI